MGATNEGDDRAARGGRVGAPFDARVQPSSYSGDGRFEALIEALLLGGSVLTVAAAIGHQIGAAGTTLSEAVVGLWDVHVEVTGRPPPPATVVALVQGWNDADRRDAQADLDPTTGIGTMHYLRLRLREISARNSTAAGAGLSGWSLVVMDLSRGRPPERPRECAAIADAARRVLTDHLVVCQAGASRLIVLVRRDTALERTAVSLSQHLESHHPAVLVWVEHLPDDMESADRVINELIYS